MFVHDVNRFFMEDERGHLIAEIRFQEEKDHLVISHTYVNSKYRGQGLGGQLVEEVIKLARMEKKKVITECPFSEKLFTHNKDYHLIWLKKQS